jgi:hypothetical protein
MGKPVVEDVDEVREIEEASEYEEERDDVTDDDLSRADQVPRIVP